MLLSKRAFYGDEFFNFLMREFETSRNYLKNCGRPKTEHEKWLIQFHKDTVIITRMFLREV